MRTVATESFAVVIGGATGDDRTHPVGEALEVGGVVRAAVPVEQRAAVAETSAGPGSRPVMYPSTDTDNAVKTLLMASAFQSSLRRLWNRNR
jgi:hypothetical protein